MADRNKRVEGQLWIDREAPYNLRYFVNNTEYVVGMAASYEFDTRESGFKPMAGNVVTLQQIEGQGIKLAPAVFPDDLENIIGVVAANPLTTTEDKKDNDNKVEVVHNGYIEVPATNNVFIEDDLLFSNNGYSKSTIIGAPVYWFIGREQGIDQDPLSSKDNPGKLTLSTPAGFKLASGTAEDGTSVTFNVDYDNLPQVGTVVKVDADDSKISKIYIHLNFSKFDTSIEWIYPKEETKLEEKKTTHDILIKHGLFPIGEISKRIENFADTTVEENGKVFNCIFPINNIFTGKNIGSKLEVTADTDVKIKIHGQVSYVG